jgi:hypothetical protein
MRRRRKRHELSRMIGLSLRLRRGAPHMPRVPYPYYCIRAMVLLGLKRRVWVWALFTSTLIVLFYLAPPNGTPNFRTWRFVGEDELVLGDAPPPASDHGEHAIEGSEHVKQGAITEQMSPTEVEDEEFSVPVDHHDLPFTETTTIPSWLAPSTSPLPSAQLLYPSPAPRIQLIIIWNDRGGHKKPIYLPSFFASVAANPVLDMLFVRYDGDNITQGCGSPLAPGLANVRELCYGLDEFWEIHVDFLCERWGCNEAQRGLTRELLLDRRNSDWVSCEENATPRQPC